MIPCPLCGAPTDPRLLGQAGALRPVVVRLLMRRHPRWRPAQGVCPRCARHAALDHAASRSAFPLHERTQPPTTFPYYHPDEETVLGLPERLPDHGGFDGQGVTVAFLDSGYYPHPDLTGAPPPEGVPPWERLSAVQMRRTVEQMAPRLADFVSLIGGRLARGLDLAELWDGHGLAWHGQMTTTIAAGNGRLSSGRFRGYAPAASLLPISVGRGDGRIPEADILAGLEWLLHDRNAERLGVRVLNISIGGDFPQNWRANPVCLAAERLVERGVFVAAAAGNSAQPELLAPAQAPSVLTVGGVDDRNLLLDFTRADSAERLGLYHHNWGLVHGLRGPQRKPELLAPAAWLPSPILPPSSVFREMHAIARLRHSLRGDERGDGQGSEHLDTLVAHWQRVLHGDPTLDDEASTAEWMAEVWQAVRKRMNAHKWVHAAYQHVDGTSVAVACVTGVAAQMVQANPSLTPHHLRELLCATARPLHHMPAEKRGAGLLQPAAAVAAALRAEGGPLAGLPFSATLVRAHELRNRLVEVKVHAHPVPAGAGLAAHDSAPPPGHVAYFGLYAPSADAVSLIGDFNGWQVGACPLERTARGWWHIALPLAPGDYAYRFWVDQDTGAGWHADPENQLRVESGYFDGHSRLIVD